jgi:hypothetical protein
VVIAMMTDLDGRVAPEQIARRLRMAADFNQRRLTERRYKDLLALARCYEA